MNQETTRKLSEMNLRGFIDGCHEQESSQEYKDLTFEERFQLLVDGEYARRQSNKLQRLMKAAKFNAPSASLEDIEYHPDRNLDKQLMSELRTGNYIREHHNVIRGTWNIETEMHGSEPTKASEVLIYRDSTLFKFMK